MINGMIDLVVEEDSPPEFHLETTEVLGEVGAIKPDDDVAFDWLIMCLCVKIKCMTFV